MQLHLALGAAPGTCCQVEDTEVQGGEESSLELPSYEWLQSQNPNPCLCGSKNDAQSIRTHCKMRSHLHLAPHAPSHPSSGVRNGRKLVVQEPPLSGWTLMKTGTGGQKVPQRNMMWSLGNRPGAASCQMRVSGTFFWYQPSVGGTSQS